MSHQTLRVAVHHFSPASIGVRLSRFFTMSVTVTRCAIQGVAAPDHVIHHPHHNSDCSRDLIKQVREHHSVGVRSPKERPVGWF